MTLPKKRMQLLIFLACATVFGFAVGWKMQQRESGVWKTRDAYFLLLDGERIECLFRPSFMESLFGPDWRNDDIYIAYKGWTNGGSTHFVNGMYAPMTSLSLNYAMRDFETPKGDRWDVRVGLYSRKKRIGCALTIRMKAREVVVEKKGPVTMKEIVLPNGLLTF